MCGICGIVQGQRDRPVDRDRLEQMNDRLIHRGPDDAGQWILGNAGFAMRRLSIIDLFRGQQPMLNDDESIALIFNGEIYNFESLRSDLESRGRAFRTLCDTEVILRAYEEYGDGALEHLNGMFAFALFDVRKNRLLLARDRLGIKPLFYTIKDGAIAFASELDSLYRSGLVDGTMNRDALDRYFTQLYVPGPDTIFDGVQQVFPGQKLVFQDGRLTSDFYWRASFEPDSNWTLRSASERYAELITDAVRLQTVSDVPLGAFLSGGIDSSTIVAILSVNSAAPVKTFSIGFDDAHVDELKYARIAARCFKTDHIEAMLRPDMVQMTAEIIRHFGEPFADSSAVPTWLVSNVARRSVTVALTGDGGDELFAGYTWLHMTRKVLQYARVPAAIRRSAHAVFGAFPHSPKFEKWRRFSSDSFLTPSEVFQRRQTCFSLEQRRTLYTYEFAEQVARATRERAPFDPNGFSGPRDEDAMLYRDLTVYLPDDILTKVDRMSMANSLEARVPMLDHRLVEFACTVPFSLKLKKNVSKRLVKKAVKDLLPKELLVQRKQGFAIPVNRWFRESLRDFFEETVLGPAALNYPFLNRQAVRTLFQAHQKRLENYGHHLWAILMFEQWLRYIDGIPSLSLK